MGYAAAASYVNAASILRREIHLGDLGADLSELDCGVLLGAPVHADGEIGAAPPPGHVLGAEGFGKQSANAAQHRIGRCAAEVGCETGEGIDLQHGDRVRIGFSPRQSEEALDELGSLEGGCQTGERICFYRSLSRLDAGEAALDAHHQFGGHKGFADVVICAGGEDPLDACLIGMSGKEDHGQLAPAPIVAHDSTQLGPTDLRHLEIEQNEIRLYILEYVPEAKWIVERGDGEAATREKRGETTHRLVVDDENLATLELRFLKWVGGATGDARLLGGRRRWARR